MRWEYIAFDNYGTLQDIHTDEEKRQAWVTLANYMRMHGAAWKPAILKAAYAEDLKRQKKDAPDQEAFEADLAVTFERLYQEKGVSVDRKLIEETALVFRSATTAYFRLYPGTKKMLTALRQAGYKLLLFSNAQRLFTELQLRSLEIWECFDHQFISSDEHVKKPSAKFYQRMLDYCGIPPEKILMAGNSPKDDILPAAALGIQTCYIPSALTEKGAVRPESTLYLHGPDMVALQKMLLEAK